MSVGQALAGGVTDAAPAVPSAGGALEMFGSLLLVLIVIFALAWLARWMQGARIARGAAMQVHGGVQLGAKEKVVLLQVGEQQFLLGVTAGSVNLLHRFDDPVAMTPTGSASPLPSAFADRLRQALGGKAPQ